MRNRDKLTAFVELANAAALPSPGKRGQVFELADGGGGVPALAVWDSGASAWIITVLGGGGGGNLAWQNPVEDKDVTDPSTLTPSAGERWIVATGGVGVWSGKDDDIAGWDGVQWDFVTPTEGFACEVLDEDQYYAYTGTAWITLPDFLKAVSGPASSTDHAISRFDGTTGLKIQDSFVTISDAGKVEVKNALAELFFSVEDVTAFAALVNVIGTTANPNALFIALAKAAANDSFVGFGVSTAPSTPEMIVGYSGSVGVVIVQTTGTKTLAISSVDKPGATSQPVTINTGNANITGPTSRSTGDAAAGPSGDIEDITGSSAGGTRGDVKSNSLNVIRKLGDAAGATKWSLTDSADGEVAKIDSNGTLENVGGRIIGITTIADADHTIVLDDYQISYTSISVTRTVNLPAVAGVPDGQVFEVKDESGSVTPSIKITIDPNGGETIDGVATLDIVTAYGAAEFYKRGSAWFTR